MGNPRGGSSPLFRTAGPAMAWGLFLAVAVCTLLLAKRLDDRERRRWDDRRGGRRGS
ncbi:MAG: hypothetical protein NZ898_01165 [Myxococcota bacterium]|nr:hypothetical protein [Myxococcota bacterium]MDW8360795.1 hypothetical protein [Myxococcales bacterium]